MKRLLLVAVAMLALGAKAQTTNLSFTWSAPTTWADGRPLVPTNDLLRYEMLWGTNSRVYFAKATGTVAQKIAVIPNWPVSQRVYAAVVAVGSNNAVSAFSDEAQWVGTVAAPSQPGTPITQATGSLHEELVWSDAFGGYVRVLRP